MKKIGLTGGTGSGKTTVSNIFRELGYTIIDADQIAREVVMPGRPELEEIKNAFGLPIMKGASLNRKELGKIVFSDPEALKTLNSITHPSIRQLMQMQMEFFENEGRIKTLILDIPLLYEGGWQNQLDSVIVVDADKKTRLRRLIMRDHISEQQAINRIAAQMPLEEKVDRADFVVDNSRDKASLKECVLKFISENKFEP
ncbi:dephospho-CoA kinase [Oenococcus oeni]|nr:dephospho-CoA kinase [Oenococcus oeni]OIK65190.1 dephospho-CoA kinase [Oenococcus oeni]OIK74704.1 dephospho-CoA kinase [Oenococcus oeni]OIK77235.1 dephospho-CoA kinase [Oenococcus oeni]OIK79702.1 dephospho-CoA kinase [Oenococcus oeni]OIL13197.1 dephospho-CoA kinase [Oenococcus oeni]